MDPFSQGLPLLFANPLIWIPLIIWSLSWKGFALWHAARTGSRRWFVALLVINTAGLLEILYLFIFRKKQALQWKSSSES